MTPGTNVRAAALTDAQTREAAYPISCSERRNNMLQSRFWSKASAVLALLSVTLLTAVHGQTETVLHSFSNNGTDGYNPYADVTPDAKGNIYGTTYRGGAFGSGSVYKIAPSGTETILHSFNPDGKDGFNPLGAPVVRDKAGNLYGTTYQGGASGNGTVFKIDPSGTETVLHSFNVDGIDGYLPNAGLVLDKVGNLYGTTYAGGTFGLGTVFKVSASGIETVLHSFDGTDGCYPSDAGVVLGKKNTMYGTASQCGANGVGTVFKLTQTGVLTVLHHFAADGVDGNLPYAGVVLDKKTGDVYGTTNQGGAFGVGTVYKVTSSGAESVLHSFAADGKDGLNPAASLAFDKKTGNLYGTTVGGGAHKLGTVFKLTPDGTETILHSFVNDGTDGYQPYFSGVILGKQGVLYGTTVAGGTFGQGTVYKIVP
jgi:uncharacterized repeat protein (TIGR03803 family)